METCFETLSGVCPPPELLAAKFPRPRGCPFRYISIAYMYRKGARVIHPATKNLMLKQTGRERTRETPLTQRNSRI